MNRRQFITLLGGAAAWPVAADAQSERVRRIGVLMPWVEDDGQAQSRLKAFEDALRELGWTADSHDETVRNGFWRSTSATVAVKKGHRSEVALTF